MGRHMTDKDDGDDIFFCFIMYAWEMEMVLGRNAGVSKERNKKEQEVYEIQAKEKHTQDLLKHADAMIGEPSLDPEEQKT